MEKAVGRREKIRGAFSRKDHEEAQLPSCQEGQMRKVATNDSGWLGRRKAYIYKRLRNDFMGEYAAFTRWFEVMLLVILTTLIFCVAVLHRCSQYPEYSRLGRWACFQDCGAENLCDEWSGHGFECLPF